MILSCIIFYVKLNKNLYALTKLANNLHSRNPGMLIDQNKMAYIFSQSQNPKTSLTHLPK